MTTAGARLVFLSGGGSAAAGARLASLAAGANAGARLVARSGLPSATAAVHLMYDPAPPAPPSGKVGLPLFMQNVGKMLSR